jgi:hypothetical protein
MVDEHPTTLAVVDGGMIGGWRRSTPSLDQLDQALQDLGRAHPGLAVTVVGDPALKHSLPAAEQERLEAGIATRSIVLAPAGTIGGFSRFLAEIVRRAEARGLAPIVVTDQSVEGATLGQARIEADRWTFDLGPVSIPAAAASTASAALAAGPVSIFALPARKKRRPARTSDAGGRSGPRRKSKRVARGPAKVTRPMAHDRLLQAMAAVLAEADPDGRLVDRMVDPEAVGRAAARALLRSTR